MKVIHHPDCLLHNPPHEILSGKLVPYAESPDRIQLIRDALDQSGQFDLSDSLDHDLDVRKCILDVHDIDYISYLKTAYVDWVNDGGSKVNATLTSRMNPHRKLSNTVGSCVTRIFRSCRSSREGC